MMTTIGFGFFIGDDLPVRRPPALRRSAFRGGEVLGFGLRRGNSAADFKVKGSAISNALGRKPAAKMLCTALAAWRKLRKLAARVPRVGG